MTTLYAGTLPFQSFQWTARKGWNAPLPRELNSPRTLVVAFGSSGIPESDPVFSDISAAFADSVVTGCSTSGEIHAQQLSDDSVTLGVYSFRESQVRSAVAPLRGPEDSFKAGALLAEQLRAPDLRGVLVYSDGLNVNGTELVRGLTACLDPAVVVTGGLAADGTAFKSTWVMHAGRRASCAVTAVGLYGPRLRIGSGSIGGWDAFGPERLVTRSKGHILYELDGQPALALYKRYLGDRASQLPSSALLFPMALRSSRNDPITVVRTILGVNESDQSLTFAGDMPEGSTAQLMLANFDRLVSGAERSAVLARAKVATTPCLCIAISCVGRRLVLGERTEEELEAVMLQLPPGSVQVGFYSYGEISPSGGAGCQLHNQTMTLTTIRED